MNTVIVKDGGSPVSTSFLSELQPVGPVKASVDVVLAERSREFVRLLASYEATLRAIDENEASVGTQAETDAITYRALDAARKCTDALQSMTASAASPLGVFAKVDALCAALVLGDVDQTILRRLGLSVRGDLVRIKVLDWLRSTEESRWVPAR